MGRYSRLRKIQALDPDSDYQEIYRISAEYEFPWDLQRALELALFRTYAVPTIGDLLDRTGEFARRGQKRYDDTVVLLYEMMQDGGLDSVRGRAALRHMNRIHGKYDITNDDFLYVLSTFIVVPVRWMDDYGWRPYSDHEVRATVNTFRHIGRLMGLKEIPSGYAEFAGFMDDYERKHYAYAEANQRVAEATIGIFEGWFPGFLRPLARAGLRAMTDTPLRQALGLRRAPQGMETAAGTALKARARVVRLLPPRPESRPKKPHLRSYPDGYELGDIGPEWATEHGRAAS